MRLLLAEDDPSLAVLILEGLAEDSLNIEHTTDTTTAEGICALRSFDLPLDVTLPEGPQVGSGWRGCWYQIGPPPPQPPFAFAPFGYWEYQGEKR